MSTKCTDSINLRRIQGQEPNSPGLASQRQGEGSGRPGFQGSASRSGWPGPIAPVRTRRGSGCWEGPLLVATAVTAPGVDQGAVRGGDSRVERSRRRAHRNRGDQLSAAVTSAKTLLAPPCREVAGGLPGQGLRRRLRGYCSCRGATITCTTGLLRTGGQGIRVANSVRRWVHRR